MIRTVASATYDFDSSNLRALPLSFKEVLVVGPYDVGIEALRLILYSKYSCLRGLPANCWRSANNINQKTKTIAEC